MNNHNLHHSSGYMAEVGYYSLAQHSESLQCIVSIQRHVIRRIKEGSGANDTLKMRLKSLEMMKTVHLQFLQQSRITAENDYLRFMPVAS